MRHSPLPRWGRGCGAHAFPSLPRKGPPGGTGGVSDPRRVSALRGGSALFPERGIPEGAARF